MTINCFPLDYATDDGDLTIEGVVSGVPMRCAAWAVVDLTPLWLPAMQRGRNRIIPGASGMIVNRRRKTQTLHPLTLVVSGGTDLNGNPYTDVWDGLYQNMLYLKQQVFDPPGGSAVSRTAVLTLPDASTLTAEVQIEDVSAVDRKGPVHIYTMDLILPMGEFS